MRTYFVVVLLSLTVSGVSSLHAAPQSNLLGLPPVPVPADNPQTDAKIKLGDQLYHDERFSADGKVSCATCHSREKGFTDNLRVSIGFKKQMGTRNAPTVINAAYYTSLFWDGREPDLEGQSKQPPINPVEGGLANHEPILNVIRNDEKYTKAFNDVFGVSGDSISMEHVSRAIASFERTIVSGNSPFDQYNYAGNKKAMTASQIRGLEIFRLNGRCVSCHVIEETQAIFTDNRFHNIGIGFKKIQHTEAETAAKMLASKRRGEDIDVTVLTQENLSEIGRFAVTENPTHVGAFKTPTLRNIAVTFPYMHDGSLKTLKDVVDFYDNGGRVKESDALSGFLSGGIKPLGLSNKEKKDLVAFLEALTSPEYQHLVNK